MRKIDHRKRILDTLRQHLFDTHVKAMYQIYKKMRDDDKLDSLLDLEIITEEEHYEVIESTLYNLQEFIIENPHHYDN